MVTNIFIPIMPPILGFSQTLCIFWRKEMLTIQSTIKIFSSSFFPQTKYMFVESKSNMFSTQLLYPMSKNYSRNFMVFFENLCEYGPR